MHVMSCTYMQFFVVVLVHVVCLMCVIGGKLNRCVSFRVAHEIEPDDEE